MTLTLDRKPIADFLAHLSRERRLSPHTSSNYARDLAALAEFLDRGSVGDWKSVDGQHIRMLAARPHAGGLNPRSVQRRLSAPRSFFTYLHRERAAAANPRSTSARRRP